MTNDILQSDIDLARRLLDARRPSEEIVAALTYRGINGDRAAQLIAALQAGKTVEPDRPITISLPSKTVEETAPSEPQYSRKSTVSASAAERPQESRPSRRGGGAFPWFTAIALAAAAVCFGAFVLVSRKSHLSHSLAAGDPAADKRASVLDAAAISLEIEPRGLRLCGNSLTRENFLPAVFKILGAPTRTNQLEKVDQVIYAYDNCGLLVYSPKNSIVLDFDASYGAAGPAGTKNAFVGTFKINRQVVRPGTDAAALSSIKELGLQAPQSASGIFHAQYGTVELVFGYLKTPERLSLIEIDFR
jgi:hypothetical protein